MKPVGSLGPVGDVSRSVAAGDQVAKKGLDSAQDSPRAITGGQDASIPVAISRLSKLAVERAAIASEEAEILAKLALNVDIQLAGSGPKSVMGSMENRAHTPNPPNVGVRADSRLMTATAVATRLAVDIKTLRRWRSDGLIPPPIEFGGVLRWRPDVIEAWLLERESKSREKLRRSNRGGSR